MPTPPPALLESEPDLAVLEKVATFERFCLAVVITIAAANLVVWCIPDPGHRLASSLYLMPPEAGIAAMLGALSLRFSGTRNSKQLHRLSLLLAVLVMLIGTAILAGTLFQLPTASHVQFARYPVFPYFLPGMVPQTAAGFALLGLTMIFARARGRVSSIAADVLTVALLLLVLILVSGHILAMWHVFGPMERSRTSSQTMACLLLLTQGVFFRRAEHGVFSILLGRGVASRVARVFAPILLVVPFLREAMRAEFIGTEKIPPHYTTAILASVNVVVALFMLLYLAWRINHLETDIRDLSLRDGLTGLYNIRGFHILAEQSLRMAHRSKEPFSVLFIDLDDLKQTNDLLGHQAGSEFLIETGDILKDTFRETDVLGRIGGDEFAVAGQFSKSAISHAAQRLEESAEMQNAEAGRRMCLSFSIGHVTTDTGQHESLDELLAKADEAMYQEKRRKKVVLS
jgi:diguanylate cyclase (GGDEF)-like protein